MCTAFSCSRWGAPLIAGHGLSLVVRFLSLQPGSLGAWASVVEVHELSYPEVDDMGLFLYQDLICVPLH